MADFSPMRQALPYERVDINSLSFDPRNARKHSKKNIKAIKDSLVKFGQQKPIVVNADNVVIAGNGTLQAARELKWETIDVHRSNLRGDEATAFGLVDNRSAELAEWDNDTLGTLLSELDGLGWDLEGLGWDDKDMNGLVHTGTDGLTDEDAVPEVEQNVFGVKLGDIWQLGDHRLMCGDSTDKATVEKLMNGVKADMVFTDPPYGMSAVEKSAVLSKRYKPILGDSNTDVVKKSCEYLLSLNIPTILWGANYYSSCLPDASCWIVWDKNNGGSDQTDCELAWTNFKGVVRQFTQASEKTNRVHPTQKPISLMEYVFNKYDCGHLVIDLFLGSGSTMIACEKTGRNARPQTSH